MRSGRSWGNGALAVVAVGFVLVASWSLDAQHFAPPRAPIGSEMSVPHHLAEDEEFTLSLPALVEHGRRLFMANWTEQEGGGRPLMKGTGKELSDTTNPLVGKRSFNRVSAPDANSCYGCHNSPYGSVGGGGDFVTNVFVLAQRFDFVDFENADKMPTRSATDEAGNAVTSSTVGNLRSTTGMFGGGYLEMVAREITTDLHKIRDGLKHGQSADLVSKGISFGTLTRRADGMWDTSKVTGLPRLSILAPTPIERPTLVIRPWHQASNVVSLREFTNTAYNHHHGIQSVERFGRDTDLDGDGFTNEMTRADVTAVSVFQATMPVPGRMIPRDRDVEEAVVLGERRFADVGCARCHVPELPLTRSGWSYSEPNPFNPITNLRMGDAKVLRLDLTDPRLPQPRLVPATADADVIMVPAYTDFKLHDITDPDDPSEAEPLDMNQSLVSPRLLGGNRRFLTKRLWGAANEQPYFHHGRFTTMRQAVLAHNGEALTERRAFQNLPPREADAIIEFLKTLQVLPPGTKDLIVDEDFKARPWPPAWATERPTQTAGVRR